MHIFISYRRGDDEWAQRLAEQLQSLGDRVWIDKLQLRPGEDWNEQIKQAIQDSETVVSIIGESGPSPNVLVEMGMALALQKRVIPVLISPDADTSGIPVRLLRVSTEDPDEAAEAIEKASE